MHYKNMCTNTNPNAAAYGLCPGAGGRLGELGKAFTFSYLLCFCDVACLVIQGTGLMEMFLSH